VSEQPSAQRKALLDSLDAAFGFLRWAGVLAVIAVLCSGITFVRPDEVALVMRFGRLTGATPADQVHRPGVLLALPYLVDQVVRVPVKRVQEVPISLFSGQPFAEAPEPDPKTKEPPSPLDPRIVAYCVTGDRNIIHADALAKFQVTDPVAYALRIHEPERIIGDVVSGALIQCVGRTGVDAVLAEGKRKLASDVLKHAQQRLDAIWAGVSLVAFEFREVKPPDDVAPDFQAVVSAYVERSTSIRNAETYREQETPKAQADRNEAISDAEAFKADRLAQARGDVSTFRSVLAQYKQNPGVVRERVYRESVERVMAGVGSRVLIPRSQDRVRTLLPVTPAEGRKGP